MAPKKISTAQRAAMTSRQLDLQSHVAKSSKHPNKRLAAAEADAYEVGRRDVSQQVRTTAATPPPKPPAKRSRTSLQEAVPGAASLTTLADAALGIAPSAPLADRLKSAFGRVEHSTTNAARLARDLLLEGDTTRAVMSDIRRIVDDATSQANDARAAAATAMRAANAATSRAEKAATAAALAESQLISAKGEVAGLASQLSAAKGASIAAQQGVVSQLENVKERFAAAQGTMATLRNANMRLEQDVKTLDLAHVNSAKVHAGLNNALVVAGNLAASSAQKTSLLQEENNELKQQLDALKQRLDRAIQVEKKASYAYQEQRKRTKEAEGQVAAAKAGADEAKRMAAEVGRRSAETLLQRFSALDAAQAEAAALRDQVARGKEIIKGFISPVRAQHASAEAYLGDDEPTADVAARLSMSATSLMNTNTLAVSLNTAVIPPGLDP